MYRNLGAGVRLVLGQLKDCLFQFIEVSILLLVTICDRNLVQERENHNSTVLESNSVDGI